MNKIKISKFENERISRQIWCQTKEKSELNTNMTSKLWKNPKTIQKEPNCANWNKFVVSILFDKWTVSMLQFEWEERHAAPRAL